MKLLDWFLRLVYPPKCTFCRSLLLDQETDLCASCRVNLPDISDTLRHGPYFESCRSVFSYKDQVAEAVIRYKFQGFTQYAPVFGRLIAQMLLKSGTDFDLITWVPVSSGRLRKRGYDQSRLLAEAVARELQVPVYCTLVKHYNSPSQTSMTSAAGRRANVAGVFSCREPRLCQGKRILIIDDVITTGATLSECSSILKSSGASEVVAATLASAIFDDNK